MKRLPALAMLLTMAFLLAACGGGQAGQAPEQSQPEPSTEESVPQETTEGEGAPAESTAPESATPEDERGSQEEDSGYSVTTLDGEEVSLGGGGDVTALFFMAGW